MTPKGNVEKKNRVDLQRFINVDDDDDNRIKMMEKMHRNNPNKNELERHTSLMTLITP